MASRKKRLTRIFQIGFNKCGTRTLTAFLRANDIDAVHFRRGSLATTIEDNLLSGRKPLHGVDRWTAYTDMQHVSAARVVEANRYFRELHAYYPNAYFILNLRDKEKWIASRLNHGNGFYAKRYARGLNLASEAEVLQHWSDQWDVHLEQVETYFADHPRYLRFDIEKDAPQKLSDFLSDDFKTDPSLFGHEGATVDTVESTQTEAGALP